MSLPIESIGPVNQYASGGSSIQLGWLRLTSSRLRLVAARASFAAAMLILVAAVGLFAFRTLYSEKIYPSISVAGVEVGGLTSAQASEKLQSQADAILASTLTLWFGKQTWNPTLEELGVTVDLPAALASAYDIGREPDARARVDSALTLIQGERTVPLQLQVSQTGLNEWFDRVDSDIAMPAANAYLVIDNGVVSVMPDQNGTEVDRDAARAIVISSLETLQPFQGLLPTKAEVARIHVADLAIAKSHLETALKTPVKLDYGKNDWSLTGVDMGEFVVVGIDPAQTGAAAVTLSIDDKKLGKYLSSLLRDEIDQSPQNAEVAWSYDKDKLVSAETSRDGIELRPQKLAEAVISSFWGSTKVVEIPVTVTKPEIDSKNLKALGITTRLAVGDSSFEGSDYGRSTNVQVGSSLLNGTLIPPQGEFSFNHSIGEITEELGYVEAGVVVGERIGKDIGGGICQVSTTVFRAAFFAGLPIVEWNPHRYRLGFYEQDGWSPGLDASILQPEGDPFNGGDFRFSNPSESWMMIESFTEGSRIYVAIFGADLGYDVQINGPYYPETKYPPTDDMEIVDGELPGGTVQQSEYELEGMDVTFQRTVYDQDGKLLWDRTFGTHFYPRGNVYKVSPDMVGKSPAAQDGN